MSIERKWLTTEEAAGYLSLSVKTLWNRRSMRQRPHCKKIGKVLRYHLDELDNFIETNGAELTIPRRQRRA